MRLPLLLLPAFFISNFLYAQTGQNNQKQQAVAAAFKQFIEAENAADTALVRQMTWESPDMAFIATGKADSGRYVTWGSNQVLAQLQKLYSLHIHLSPDWAQEKIAFLGKDVAELLVPVGISFPTRQTPAPFCVITYWVWRNKEWKLATDIAIPLAR